MMTDQDWTIYQGETAVVEFAPLTDGDGNPLDLTGLGLRWYWTRSVDSDPTGALHAFDETDFVLFNSAATNDGARCMVVPTVTRDMAVGAYYHELRVIQVVDVIEWPLASGTVTVAASVTRS